MSSRGSHRKVQKNVLRMAVLPSDEQMVARMLFWQSAIPWQYLPTPRELPVSPGRPQQDWMTMSPEDELRSGIDMAMSVSAGAGLLQDSEARHRIRIRFRIRRRVARPLRGVNRGACGHPAGGSDMRR